MASRVEWSPYVLIWRPSVPPPPHYRLTYSGVFGASPTDSFEIWSMGLSFAYESDAATVADLASLASTASARWGYWWKGELVNNVHLTRTRIAAVGGDGKVLLNADGAYLQGDSLTVQTCTAGVPTMPSQVALAVTLQSPAAGQVGRGRFFLPGPKYPAGTDGRIDATSQGGALTAAAGFVDDLNSLVAGGVALGAVCVASGGSVLKGIPPATYRVSSVEVGRVLDTQRRRRGELAEEYASRAVA